MLSSACRGDRQQSPGDTQGHSGPFLPSYPVFRLGSLLPLPVTVWERNFSKGFGRSQVAAHMVLGPGSKRQQAGKGPARVPRPFTPNPSTISPERAGKQTQHQRGDASSPQPHGKAGGQPHLGTDLWSNTRWQQLTEAVQILTHRTQTQPTARSQPHALGVYASAKSKVLKAHRKPRGKQPECCWASHVLAKRSGRQPFPKAKRIWSCRERIFSG